MASTILNNNEIYHEPVYTIGHAAKKLGVTAQTLRVYEQAGLFIPHRTETNRRLYSRHDIAHLQIIIDLIRNHKINIEAIRRIAALTPCWRIIDCPPERYEVCPAYVDNTAPCWLLDIPNCGHSKDECRSCDVYLDCPKILKDPKSYLK